MAASTYINQLISVVLLSLLLSATACGTCQTPKVQLPPTALEPAPPTSCPRDTLKLGVCADLLGLVNIALGAPPSGSKCCALLEGLTGLEAALCLCTAIKANVLGINLEVPVSLSLILSACQKTVPSDFQCA